MYCEAIGLIIESITDRFNQPGYGLYSNLEQLLLKAVRHEDYEEEFKSVAELYHSDLHIKDLKIQLTTLLCNCLILTHLFLTSWSICRHLIRLPIASILKLLL